MEDTQTLTDIRPYPNRSDQADRELLEKEKAELAAKLRAIFEGKKYEALVLHSLPRESECWVEVKSWTPSKSNPKDSLRRGFKISLSSHPELRFARGYTLEHFPVAPRGKISNIRELTDENCERLVDYVLGDTGRLSRRSFKRFYAPGGRTIDLFFLPRNRPKDLDRTIIARVRKNWLPGIAIAGIFGLFTLAVPVIALPFLAFAGFCGWLRWRYPILHERPPVYPKTDPRSLLRYDSWHTVIPEIGHLAATLRDSVMDDLKDGKHDDAVIEIERVHNYGIDTVYVRDQIHLAFRRCSVFIEIHAYGADLYIDWEAFLNIGSWGEGRSYAGFEQDGDVPIIVHNLVPTVRALEEFDFSDANFSTEWSHATIQRQVKRLLSEHKIDQDIDFRVIREMRGSVRDEGRRRAKESGEKKGFGKVFKILSQSSDG